MPMCTTIRIARDLRKIADRRVGVLQLLVGAALLLVSGLAVAQSSDHVEVFGGYSYLSQDLSLASPNGANGWNASADFKIRPWFGFVADFSGFSASHTYGTCPSCVSESG